MMERREPRQGGRDGGAVETFSSSRRPHGTARLLPAVAPALALLLALGPGPRSPQLAAQTVVGTVMDAESSDPLAGVLVSVLDVQDERVAATLTDDAGAFALELESFGRYRLRAERIGLRTSTSASFDLFSTIPREETVLMGQRAIEIDGLVVDSRVEQCRLDPRNAVTLQRWWREVRTALDVSSVVQRQGLARFRLERFEREWDRELSGILAEGRYSELGVSSRPFVSVDAAFLAEEGFIQGDLDSPKDYYAPDADVLLSDIFLARHCFRLSDHDDDELLGLAFQPTTTAVADIEGTLWVDTTTAELQSLDFRYANQDEAVPDNESGGFVSFEYLPSGAWMVREWYIRMPSLARDLEGRITLTGYVDVGGRAEPLEVERVSATEGGAVGAVRGVVWDSIGDRGLAGASVSVLGSGLSALTDEAGEFVLPSVPVGEHRLTFSHPEPEAWGIGSPLVTVEVRERRTSDVRLGVPAFRRVASVVCLGGGLRAAAVLVGDVVGADGRALEGVTMVLTWPGDDPRGPPTRREVRVDADGRFVACTIPPDTSIQVNARFDGVLVRGFEVSVPLAGIEYRRIQLPLRG